ncbi:MAG: hypothetical protein WBH44_07930 [Proteocatella sp.]
MKTNFKKRIIAAASIIAMLTSSISFASDNSVKNSTLSSGPVLNLNINNIEQIMLDRSPTVKKIKNDSWTTQQKYDDIDDSISDLHDNIDDLKAQKDDDGKPVDNSSQISALYGQVNSLYSTKDQLSLASDTAQALLSQQVNGQVLKAKQLFVNCLADEAGLLVTASDYTQKQKDLEVAAEKLKRGYISQNAYDALVNTTDDMDVSLDASASKKDANLRELKNLLGVDKNTFIILEAVDIPDFELEMIERLNFESDLDDLMRNSAAVKSAQLSYDAKSRSTSYNDYDENSAQANLKTSKDTVSANFKKQYDTLLNSYKALKVTREKLNSQLKYFETEKIKLEKGYISQASFANTTIATDHLTNQADTTENLLYVSLLSYRQTRDGN